MDDRAMRIRESPYENPIIAIGQDVTISDQRS